MPLPQLPFVDAEVLAAFPDRDVVVPALGQGSYKVAYRANHSAGDCVLKVIYDFKVSEDPDDFDLDQIPDRISRELIGMGAANSPHLVKLLAPPTLRRIGAYSFLCYEEPFYGGGTLETVLKNGPLDRKEVRSLLVALLRASNALWNSGRIVHRDIKPGNIAFDGDGVPVLLDLGLALFTELSALTNSQWISPMTPLYAAPEQFERRSDAQLDFRTDQYAIGLTVLEAATGAHPFFRQLMDEMRLLQAMEDFGPSGLPEDSLDEDVREVLGRLLAYRMYGRYRDPSLPLRKLGVSE
ncbi:MAG: protein kinase domain-containing protein [Leucobacter sp.]